MYRSEGLSSEFISISYIVDELISLLSMKYFTTNAPDTHTLASLSHSLSCTSTSPSYTPSKNITTVVYYLLLVLALMTLRVLL